MSTCWYARSPLNNDKVGVEVGLIVAVGVGEFNGDWVGVREGVGVYVGEGNGVGVGGCCMDHPTRAR